MQSGEGDDAGGAKKGGRGERRASDRTMYRRVIRFLALAYILIWERAEARPVAFWSVLTITLLSAGGAVGFAVGYWMAPEPERTAVTPLEPVFPDSIANGERPLELSRPPPGVLGEGGYELPVRVEKPPLSEADEGARQYEEPLEKQPEEIRPDPDSAAGTLGYDPIAPEAVGNSSTQSTQSHDSPRGVTRSETEPPGSEEDARALAALGRDRVESEPAKPRAQKAVSSPDVQWRRNAIEFQAVPGVPMVAIVIDDVGVNLVHSRKAVTLPGPMTFAFLPYGFDLDALVAEARQNGHEILVHLPMEPVSRDADPGPQALLTGLSNDELGRRIAWNLSRFDSYIGVNNHMGSLFTADEPAMRRVLEEVKARGLIYLDSLTTRETKGYRLAKEMQVPHVSRDIFLDHVQDVDAIRRQLEKVEAKALERGWAVAIGHPHDETRQALREWVETLDNSEIQLVPLSAILRERVNEK